MGRKITQAEIDGLVEWNKTHNTFISVEAYQDMLDWMPSKAQAKEVLKNLNVIEASDHTCHSNEPVEAAYILSGFWLLDTSSAIDLWSRGEHHCKEFYFAFFEVAAQSGKFEEARNLTWYFDCQTGACSFPDYVPQDVEVKQWAEEFAAVKLNEVQVIPEEFRSLPVYDWDDEHGETEWISIGVDGKLWHCIGGKSHLV
jgi:hypothetical protein